MSSFGFVSCDVSRWKSLTNRFHAKSHGVTHGAAFGPGCGATCVSGAGLFLLTLCMLVRWLIRCIRYTIRDKFIDQLAGVWRAQIVTAVVWEVASESLWLLR